MATDRPSIACPTPSTSASTAPKATNCSPRPHRSPPQPARPATAVGTPSPVLTAMGLGPQQALGALRLSLGRWSTPHDVDIAASALVASGTRA